MQDHPNVDLSDMLASCVTASCCPPPLPSSQIPICYNEYNNHMNPLNLVFRIILPIVTTFIAICFTRFWPTYIVGHLQVSVLLKMYYCNNS